MTIVNSSDISIEMFLAVMFFLLIIAPLVSLGVLRLFQGRRKAGLFLIGIGVAGYLIFQLVAGLIS